MITQLITVSLALIAACISVTVGIIVWSGERQSAMRQSFVLLAGYVCLWILSNVVFVLDSESLRYAVALFSYGIALLVAVQLLVFSIYLARVEVTLKKRRMLVVGGYVGAFLSMTPGLVASGVSGSTVTTHTFVLGIYGLVLLSYIISSCIILFRARRRLKRGARQQVTIVLLGMAVSSVLGAFCNLVLPFFGEYRFVQLGPASAAGFIGMVAYAVVKHGLFNVRLAIVRSIVYFFILASMVGIYFLIAYLFAVLVGGSLFSTEQAVLNVLIAMILALVFQPIKQFFDWGAGKLLYRDNYSIDEFIVRLTHITASTSDLQRLLTRGGVEVADTFHVEQGFFVVQTTNDVLVMGGTRQHQKIPRQDFTALTEYIGGSREVIITDVLAPRESIRRMLISHAIAIAVPLVSQGRVLGFLLLGEKQNGVFDKRDIRVLAAISDELAIAIQNALSIQDVKEFNATLQQRIDSATKELRASNAELQRLDETKDEFVSMASHQLRTPLTSVKGYISMVLEGDAGEITEMQHKLLTEAFESSERMVRLINDFLNVSRLQNGKFVLERHQMNLAVVARQEVDSLQTTAKAHSMKLKLIKPKEVTPLYIDEGKLRQVIMNFLDNAIYYSRENSTITVTIAQTAKDISLTVQDTGIGVPRSEQAHLFGKFYRASNARRQRPDGTGVGLFLAKKVIVAHGGSMIFESEEGKGSTFGFRLPIARLRLAPASETDDLTDKKDQ